MEWGLGELMVTSSDNNPPKNRGKALGNPLAVISALIVVVELAFAYPVTQLSGSNQTLVVLFMVTFPFVLYGGFLLLVWFKPAHLYAPKDYEADKSFLDAIGKAQPSGTPAISEFDIEPSFDRQRLSKKMPKDPSDVGPSFKESIDQGID